jgi:nucleoside-diphosphate-sugar epimerase
VAATIADQTHPSQQVSPADLAPDLAYVSWDKARRELGFSPRPVREAIADAYAWFRETGRLPGGE